MKRFMSVALATAMIASMGVTAFAKSGDEYDYDVKEVIAHKNGWEQTNADGDELYFVLAIEGDVTADHSGNATDHNVIKDTANNANKEVDYDEIEDIDDLKVTVKFTDGEEYVLDYYIDEIDEAGHAFDGAYAVIFELADNYTTKKQKIKGELTLKNKTKKLIDEKAFSYSLDDTKVNVEVGENTYKHVLGKVTTEYTQSDAETDAKKFDTTYGVTTVKIDNVDYYVATKGGKIVYDNVVNTIGEECEFDDEDVYINLVEFNDSDYIIADFSADVENIELEDDNGFYFDVKASDQGKLNLTYDNVAIKSVARMAPVDADLTFYNFYGYPEFDFTGKVTLTPEEDDVEYFVYSVAKDGSVSKVNAKLNDDGDAYEFKTRTLGCYVLTDMELDIEEDAAVEAPVVDDAPVAEDAVVVAPETGKTNPGTGC